MIPSCRNPPRLPISGSRPLRRSAHGAPLSQREANGIHMKAFTDTERVNYLRCSAMANAERKLPQLDALQ